MVSMIYIDSHGVLISTSATWGKRAEHVPDVGVASWVRLCIPGNGTFCQKKKLDDAHNYMQDLAKT